MTQEDWKLILPFVQAGADGKRIEGRTMDSTNWFGVTWSEAVTIAKEGRIRIAPEPTFVQCADDEVPLDAWYRRSVKPNEWFKIKSRFFHEVHNRIRYEMTNPIDLSPDAKSLSLDYEHSTDGCKTWKRCGKEIVK